MRFLLTTTLWVALAAPLLAATPRDELLHLVPGDSGFCFIIQDLRGHWAELKDSPLMQEWRGSPLGKALARSPEVQQLRRAEQKFKDKLGVSSAQIRDEIFGDAIVLAYRPAPADKPEQEQGLMLVRAHDASLMTNLIKRLNDAQKEDGELRELEERKHGGQVYVRRVGREATHYYFVRGPVLAFTSSEEMIRRVIDLAQSKPKGAPIIAQRLKQLGLDNAFAVLWVNPRPFDAELAAKVRAARDVEASVLDKILVYWKALDGVALSLAMHTSDVELAVSFVARESDLPEAGKQLFAIQNASSDLWKRFPATSLAATAGRVDVVALCNFFGDFLPDAAKQRLKDAVDRGAGAALGLDVAKDVLPNLGPDWGMCLIAPGDDSKSPFPSFLTALRVQTGKGDKPVDRALLSGLNSLAILGVLAHNNSKPEKISLSTDWQDKIEVKYFSGDKALPPGFRPAYALKEGYLLLATSPDAIRQFGAGKQGEVPDQGLLARISLKAVGAYLTKHKAALAADLARREGVSAQEIERRFQGLVLLARFVETVDLRRKVAEGQMSLMLHIKTVKPLRK